MGVMGAIIAPYVVLQSRSLRHVLCHGHGCHTSVTIMVVAPRGVAFMVAVIIVLHGAAAIVIIVMSLDHKRGSQ